MWSCRLDRNQQGAIVPILYLYLAPVHLTYVFNSTNWTNCTAIPREWSRDCARSTWISAKQAVTSGHKVSNTAIAATFQSGAAFPIRGRFVVSYAVNPMNQHKAEETHNLSELTLLFLAQKQQIGISIAVKLSIKMWLIWGQNICVALKMIAPHSSVKTAETSL